MPKHLSNRKGFALPLAIFVIAILTAALAAGLASSSAELTTNAAERGQARAFSVAEAGLERFLVLGSSPTYCPTCGDPLVDDSEYVRDALPGGYADIVATKVRPAIGNSNAIYFIRSTGTDTTVKLNGASRAKVAQRTVGIYATWVTSTINVQAAWVSLSGLNKNGSGVITGVDQCGKQPDVAGVMVDKGDLHVQGNSFHPAGSPPIDTSNTFAQLKAKTNIDWDGIVNGNSIPADITIPGQAFPTDFSDTTYWPIIRIHTNGYSLPNAGQGMIIADSNFTISGSNMWKGIILVGGQLTSNGNNTTSGATLSGLNFLIGGTPSTSSVDDSQANGAKTYEYNSCNVSKATSSMKKYAAIPNTWTDNLSTW